MNLADIERAMQRAYDAAAPTAWPSPRPPTAIPRDDEYERVTQPERCHVVHARAAAWAEALIASGEVTRVVAGDTTVLRSSRPGTAPLVLTCRLVPTTGGFGDLPMLDVGIGDPPITLANEPDCGCDACDSGSASLLEVVDDAVAAIVGGPVVILRGDGWEARWTGTRFGSSATGNWPGRRFEQLIATCEQIAAGGHPAVPKNTKVLHSVGWFRSGRSRQS